MDANRLPPDEAAGDEGKHMSKRRKPGRPRKEIPFVETSVGDKVQAVPISDIDIEDETFKFRVNLLLGRLVESIRKDGQQFPVLLRRVENREKLQIISGFRRINAIRKLGWTQVNAIVRDDLDDDEQACRISIIENEDRQTYSDIDRAHAILAYREMGKSTAEVEEIFNLGERQRQRLQTLTRFPQLVQDAIAEERIVTTQALSLMQHKRKNPDTDLAHWIRWVEANDASCAKLNAALRAAAAEESADKPVELFARKHRNGETALRFRPVRIDKSMSRVQRESVAKALREALAFLESLDGEGDA